MIKKLVVALATLITLATATDDIQQRTENERLCKIYLKKIVKYKTELKKSGRNDYYSIITLQRYITVMYHSCETAYDLKD